MTAAVIPLVATFDMYDAYAKSSFQVRGPSSLAPSLPPAVRTCTLPVLHVDRMVPQTILTPHPPSGDH